MVACDSRAAQNWQIGPRATSHVTLVRREKPIHHDRLAPWRDLAAAASRPVWRQPDLALDGYLTGVIIAPHPNRVLAGRRLR